MFFTKHVIISVRTVQGSTRGYIINDYKCEGHEEVDTNIAFFVKNTRDSGDIIIRCSDTDILVILLGNMAHIPQLGTIWLLFGTGNNQRQRHRCIWSTGKYHSPRGFASVPCIHWLRFPPTFLSNRERQPWKIYKANENYQNAFACIRKLADQNYECSIKIIEEFVCIFYITKKLGRCRSVDEARVHLFTSNYNMIDSSESFRQDLLNFDTCHRELQQHLLRTSYIGNMWKNAYLPNPCSCDPTECGWSMKPHDTYTFRWFEGDEEPQFNDAFLLFT